jgi:hypothetical protein
MRDQKLGPRNKPICIVESFVVQTLSLATARVVAARARVLFNYACHFIRTSAVHLKIVTVVHATLLKVLRVTILVGELLALAVSQYLSTLLLVLEALLFLFKGLLASKMKS